MKVDGALAQGATESLRLPPEPERSGPAHTRGSGQIQFCNRRPLAAARGRSLRTRPGRYVERMPSGDRSSYRGLDSRQSWVMALAAALSMFTVFGVGYSFGVFFESITEDFNAGSGATAIVFGVTISLSFALAPYTGGLADRVGPRPVALIGAAALAAGLLTTTLVSHIALAYLAYGIGVGVAISCGYVPMVAVVSGWFERRRSLAMGVAVAGIGLGTLVAAPVSALLIDETSWRTAYVIYGVGGSLLLVLVSIVVRPGPASEPAPQRRRLRELLADPTFRRLYLSTVFMSFSLFIPFVFIAPYADHRGHSDVAAATLVGLIGGASIVGRLALGYLAEKAGANRLFRLCFFTMAASQLLWLLSGTSYAVLVIFAVVFGVAYGGFISLSPAVAAIQFGLKGLGGVLGAWYTAAAFGSLFGPAGAGFLIDAVDYWAGSLLGLVLGALGWAMLLGVDDEPLTTRPGRAISVTS